VCAWGENIKNERGSVVSSGENPARTSVKIIHCWALWEKEEGSTSSSQLPRIRKNPPRKKPTIKKGGGGGGKGGGIRNQWTLLFLRHMQREGQATFPDVFGGIDGKRRREIKACSGDLKKGKGGRRENQTERLLVGREKKYEPGKKRKKATDEKGVGIREEKRGGTRHIASRTPNEIVQRAKDKKKRKKRGVLSLRDVLEKEKTAIHFTLSPKTKRGKRLQKKGEGGRKNVTAWNNRCP